MTKTQAPLNQDALKVATDVYMQKNRYRKQVDGVRLYTPEKVTELVVQAYLKALPTPKEAERM